MPKLELDSVFEQKNEIAKAVENELEKVSSSLESLDRVWTLWNKNCHLIFFHISLDLKAMSHYGFEIVQTLIVDIEPDEHVKSAMNEINAGIMCSFSFFPT